MVVKKLIIVLLLSSLSCVCLKAQIITTFAGIGSTIYSGDGGAAISAGIPDPGGGVFDKYGNYYFVDDIGVNRINKIDTSGIFSTIAGGGSGGFTDGVPATSIVLYQPNAAKLDTLGNLYIAEGGTGNNRIRKVNLSTGIITTIAGIGTGGFSGDGGPATAAMIWDPNGLCFDKWGNLFISDLSNFRVRKIDTAGIIATIAGCACVGPLGDGGPATAALLNLPEGLAADDSGNIYVADGSLNRVRKINTAGIITTVAGNGTYTYIGDGMPATDAQINPLDLGFDATQQLFIADDANRRVYKIDHSGIIHLVAGNGTSTFAGDGASATAASLYFPAGVSFDPCGNLYIPEPGNRRIRKVIFDTSCDPYSHFDSATLIVNKIAFGKIGIFPNPAYNEITINATEKITGITVSNLLGQTVLNKEGNTNKEEIDVSYLPSGIYLLKITGRSGGVTTKKIIKR